MREGGIFYRKLDCADHQKYFFVNLFWNLEFIN